MDIVQSIAGYDKLHPTAITIGTFDGVHIGHQKIVRRLIANAAELGLKSMVLTFFPHPRTVLQKNSAIPLLNTLEERAKILESLGLDYLIVHPFTQEFSRLTASEFVGDILVAQLRTKKIIIGYDHRFGRNRNADITDLIAFGGLYNFEVEEISAQEIDDVSVSSTKIRKALEAGEVETANSYLGYAYMLTGNVAHGKGLGRQLGYATANLKPNDIHKLIPKNGAYVVRAEISGKMVFGMMNIGFNPTVAGQEKTIEVHFFDLHEDLYGRNLQVHLLHRLRDEQKFASVEALKTQLANDKKNALALITGP